jgi:hypothetical protein
VKGFQRPGHHEATVTTWHLLNSEITMNRAAFANCEQCRMTNSMVIDKSEPGEAEEAASVASLSGEFGDIAKPPDRNLSPEQEAVMDQAKEQLRQSGGSTQADQKNQEARLLGMSDFLADLAASGCYPLVDDLGFGSVKHRHVGFHSSLARDRNFVAQQRHCLVIVDA